MEEGARSRLTLRQMFRKQAPEKEGSKRKEAPTVGGKGGAHTQSRVGAGGIGGRTFKAHMLERRTPPGVCDFAWRGDMNRRERRTFLNILAAGTAPSVVVQLQQVLQILPPPRPTPKSLHQPP